MAKNLADKSDFLSKLKSEVLSWLMIITLIVFARSTAFGMYEIPSGSMLPTIRIGDRIFANKFAYGLWLPFVDHQIFTWQRPQRGDVVLFHSRTDSNTLIKRVVGVGGDTITFKDGRMFINGNGQGESELSGAAIPEETRFPVNVFLEHLDGSAKPHLIFRAQESSRTMADGATYTVPEGSVFCMGDNRDDSNDSRFWGVVPANEIYGKAVVRVYSLHVPDGEMLPNVRWERFFSLVN
jgi:signal peptidase I